MLVDAVRLAQDRTLGKLEPEALVFERERLRAGALEVLALLRRKRLQPLDHARVRQAPDALAFEEPARTAGPPGLLEGLLLGDAESPAHVAARDEHPHGFVEDRAARVRPRV